MTHRKLSLALAAVFVAACADAGAPAPATGESGDALTAAQCNYFASNGKVRICHATGSKKNPYTLVNVSDQACISGHAQHGGDYVAANDTNCAGGGFLPPGAPCDATLPCSAGYECRNAICQATDLCRGVTCQATSSCDYAYCDPANGACVHEATTGNDCSDGNACTGGDSCQAGACRGAALAVDDGNACTADSCDPATGVAHTAVAIDDGNACTDDACDPASGVAHTAVAIDDGNACTADSCDPSTGVAHAAIATDDANACTTDSCDPSTGVAHTAVSVDDGDPCTADACDPIAGVSHTGTTLPPATHQWTFNDGTPADSIGTADGALLGGASIALGQLIVNNAASASNQASVGQRMQAPIENGTTTKTLVTWVALDSLTQHGGSALTLESTTTNAFAQVFDGVVYAERSAGQWMAGSDNWNRSPGNNGGAAELSTGTVALAIAYDAANGISLYRDGAFYAGYTASNAQAFTGGASDALIGLRHTGCNGNCWLSGKVDEARIYPVALNACQVKLLTPVPGFIDPCVAAGGKSLDGTCFVYHPPTCTAGGNTACTTADEAEVACANSYPGGHLAAVNSSEENEVVSEVVDPSNQGFITAWIGARSSPTGGFNAGGTWTDGSAWGYTNWRTNTGEPSEGTVAGNCVQFWPENTANRSKFGVCPGGDCTGWNDVSCAANVDYGYVCQF